MERRDIVIGLVILLFLALVVYWVAKPKPQTVEIPESTPSTEKELESKFKVEIPDDASKVEMKDTTGGNSRGILFKNIVKGILVFSLLADLPDPDIGSYYQAWAVKDEGMEGEQKISLGKLILVKGGYSLDYESKQGISDYQKIIISEEKSFDNKIENKILEADLNNI